MRDNVQEYLRIAMLIGTKKKKILEIPKLH